MRPFLFATLALAVFTVTTTIETTDANAAVVCARGVVRAGCVATTGRPVVTCRYVIVNGVRVRRCV
jgi:hypothetical protein